MVSLYDFFVRAHDPRYVALAAAVCLVSAYACISLLRHASLAQGRSRLLWTLVTALAVGFGIWTTHFIGMLALRPGFMLDYEPTLTAISLLIAVTLGGIGIALAIRGVSLADQFLGGALVGIAISCMHYTGIAALVLGGGIGWNPGLVAASVIAGIVLGGLAFVAAMRGRAVMGVLLLAVAICGMHFTAMAAADFSGCFPLSAASGVRAGWLSLGVALVSLLILGGAIFMMLLDKREGRRARAEQSRRRADASRLAEVTGMLELATTHMAQGLCLFDDAGYLRFHNRRVAELIGAPEQHRDLVGWHFRDLSIALQALSQDLNLDGPAAIEQRVDAIIADIRSGKTSDYLRTMRHGRIVRLQHSPIADGGWVTTLDDVTDQQRAQAEITQLAYRDSLTKILNRAAFDDEIEFALEAAQANDSNFAVVAIDLDRFKDINDSFGHAAGDHVLKTLGQRLSAVLKDGEIVARLGGDEFAALKKFTSMESLRDFLARIEDAMFTRIETDKVAINSAASMGVAIFPDDGGDRSRLLNNADLAMYRAKAEFDRHICYYEKDMDEHARQRRFMAQDLWVALESDGFHLAYQVQKSVATNAITGYEVLLRWNRPGYGMVPPADFIPIAEESGAIGAIGAWVLRQACSDAAGWPEAYKIAVNVSGVQLGQVELIETVRNILLDTGLDPARLELEVTETSIIADKQRALHILRQIKAMGVSIAIDDFGTGYSSIDTLRTFPFDRIKIDRSFMAEVDRSEQSRAIVRAILALCQSLSVPVLAEGVETQAQLDVLRAEGCTEAQGYLLGRPGAIDWSDDAAPSRASAQFR